MRNTVELHGVPVVVPLRYRSYNDAQRARVDELVGSLVRSGAEAVEIFRLTRCGDRSGDQPHHWKAVYSYTMPALKGQRRLVGHPRA